MNETTVNSTAITIVPLNRILSNPLRVCCPALPESEPPKEPPRPASELCIMIPDIRNTESIICNTVKIVAISMLYIVADNFLNAIVFV
jgi:hypothetical protein